MPKTPDPLFKFLTGTTRAGLSSRVADREIPGGVSTEAQFPGQVDKQQHALASFLIAKRMGVPVSKFIGQGKEIVTGIMSAMSGGKFFGPSGYDPNDIAANAIGIKAAMEKWSRRRPGPATGVRG